METHRVVSDGCPGHCDCRESGGLGTGCLDVSDAFSVLRARRRGVHVQGGAWGVRPWESCPGGVRTGGRAEPAGRRRRCRRSCRLVVVHHWNTEKATFEDNSQNISSYLRYLSLCILKITKYTFKSQNEALQHTTINHLLRVSDVEVSTRTVSGTTRIWATRMRSRKLPNDFDDFYI